MLDLFRRGRRVWLKTKYIVDRTNGQIKDRMREAYPSVPFAQVERRLQLLVTALYGRAIDIRPMTNELWTRARIYKFSRSDPRDAELEPTVNGETIMVPPELSARAGEAGTIARYRLMVIEQAERLARGTPRLAPHEDPLARDLYWLREGAAVDATIARNHPGFTTVLAAERTRALSHRPKSDMLTPQERGVESFVRAALETDAESIPYTSESSAASLAWARATAEQLRRDGGEYRGVPTTSFWGTLQPTTEQNASRPTEESWHSISTGNFEAEYAAAKRGDVAGDVESEGDQPKKDGSPSDGEAESPEDGPLDQKRADQKRSRGEIGHYAVSGGADLHEIIHGEKNEALPPPIFYEEWNVDRHVYVKGGAAVRLYPANEGDEEWARAQLATHGATVRQIRHQFERLRARRALLTRQRAGDDLDVQACVDAIIDRRIGNAPDDRLYLDARPARRGLAISLLVDASGSTDARVTNDWRIVDLEKIALLLATQALDALGDLYAVYAFSGRAAENVKLMTIKDFSERNAPLITRRIAGIEPGGFTRLGAALRHATRQLARQQAGHRLLLLLSDGRPNDVDHYQGDYGVEDSRQAIFEARASGIYPFCITIDKEASEYLQRIFGKAGHTILHRPQQLPTALLSVVRTLIRRPS
jgi:nitric oxide reductase NorD protein